MDRRIFRYELADAWGYTISEVTVNEKDDFGEIICFFFDITSGDERGYAKETDSYTTKIKLSSVERIKNIIMKNQEALEVDSLESPFVMDGVINRFEFIMGDGTTKEIGGFNLWAFNRKDRKSIKGEEPIKAKRVLSIYKEISNVLMSHGVNKKYLSLEMPR